MGIKSMSVICARYFSLPALVLMLSVAIANGQTASSATDRQEIGTASTSSSSDAATPTEPLFRDYRGVKIGMAVKEVRSKLDGLKESDGQDTLVSSELESAQIYYDDKGKVMAVSIDYFDTSKAPAPEVILGETLQAKADGSIYQLNRYPEAGYWVSYNRTRGDKPIVTITMQRM